MKSREAVLALAGWMVATHEGEGGLLEQLLAIKKHDIPKLKAIIKGEHPSSHQYPFTRGTGNYLNAMLDAWQLTNNTLWQTRIEKVLLATIHPADRISARGLSDAENAWSYLVLMQSIAKYLVIKHERSDYDACYSHAYHSFLHYARWMVNNEKPFMENPSQLEFPNDTWTAQDLRKAMLLFLAASFSPTEREFFNSKAEDIFDYVLKKLKSSPEVEYSRILIIVMQNHGPHSWKKNISTEPPEVINDGAKPVLSFSGLLLRISKRFWRGVVTFRPSRELSWLANRLEK